MSGGLASKDKPIIKRQKRSDVELTVSGLRQFLERSMWLGTTNRYARDMVRRLKKDQPLSKERKRHLAQYISASAALHAHDGWSYLGRSIACLLSGDAHRALHLAYYAELRAGMSLLAGGGIGIFNHQHFIISGVNTTTRLRSGLGTHRDAWNALEFWSRQPPSGALLSKLVRPAGRTLDEWFQPHGGSSALMPQARNWFMQWGMDLRLVAKDRDARNESSYRPDGIPSAWTTVPATIMNFVQDMWASLEPSTPSSFEEIDRHILRLTLEGYFRGLTGSQAADNPAFTLLVRNTVSAQGFSPAGESNWRDFLLRRQIPSDPLIFQNSSLKPGNSATDHLAVISRAALLLRIASGSVQDLLQQAGFDKATLEFWWQSIGETRGLWAPGEAPLELHDLWAEVRDAFSEVLAESPDAPGSISSLASGIGRHFNVLCSHERVGLWGVCPA